MELKVKGEPVADNKANEADLPLNDLLVSSIDSVGVIIKKKP
jgi:hypothetical protein